MRIWEVWLNGKLINDYKRKANAESKCHKLIIKHGLNPEDDLLYVRNVVTDEIISFL